MSKVFENCTILSLIFLTLAALPTEAREVKFRETPLELREGDRLVITAVHAHVRLIPSATPTRRAAQGADEASGSPSGQGVLRVRKTASGEARSRSSDGFDAWSFAVQREGTVVRIEAKGPDSKLDWENQMKTGLPEFHFEIEAASVPVEVQLREGSIVSQSWRSSAALWLGQGTVRLSQNEGPFRVHVNRGELRVDGHKGRLAIDGFAPKVFVSQLDGDLKLENFSGENSVQNLKGDLAVRSFSGQIAVNSADGNCDFEIGRGSLNLQGLSGGLNGQVDNGSVVAKFTGDANVSIESQEGAVSLNLPANSGSSVRLQSESGSIVAPDSLGSTRSGNFRTVSGRLPGAQSKGSVFVKSKSGSIRLQ